MTRLTFSIIIALLVLLGSSSLARSAPEGIQTKELNFVFLHGAGGNICTFQLISDYITEQIASYIADYERKNPGTKIQVNMLQRCYPGYVDIVTWANNIAESIDEHFHNKKDLILIGHSMGGKSALYAVANNVGGLADRVALVVTINSPIKSLNQYYVVGGTPVEQYCRARWLLSDEGVCSSVTNYDSSQDGLWVDDNKHWLAFISGEAAPLSEQFDIGGVDPWPRSMDDGVVPLSAQYSDGADLVYYGEHGHSDFAVFDEVADFMAEKILRYIFGEYVECSVLARGGIFQHEAGWVPGTDYWEDIVGELPASTDTFQHRNESFFKWQEWEDIVGWCPSGGKRSNYFVTRSGSLPFFTDIEELRWLNPDDPEDCRLYIRTRVAPRSSIQVNWSIHRQGLLQLGAERDHYQIEIFTGTPLTNITDVSWVTDDPRDVRLQINSQAERPFRWFKAQWKVYFKRALRINIIDDIS
jgi:pimeloyl-ACP methyl ester carboxylesterase